MNQLICSLASLHNRIFDGLEKITDGWFLGLTTRLVFASALLMFFWNSALIKLGDGFFGFLFPSVGAYGQIVPHAFAEAGADVSAISFYHYLIVLLGTWAEFILPALVFIGLFTRLASLGMIGFIAVMTYVDIYQHNVDATAIGAFFNRNAYEIIADQRLFWVFILLYLVIKGAGAISVDAILKRSVKPAE